MDMLKNEVKTYKGQSLAGALIIFSIAVLIAFALLPAISTAITCAELTGTNATLASLVILVMIVVVIFAGLRLAGLA